MGALENQAINSNESLESLIRFGNEYFNRVTSVLSAHGAAVNYVAPVIIRGERKTEDDKRREHELLMKKSAAVNEFSDIFNGMGAEIDEHKVRGLYEETLGRHISSAEQAEFAALGKKLDGLIVAYYDGKVIVVGPNADRETVAHEVNHAVQHQTMGVFEPHTGYSSFDSLLISASGDERERIAPEIVEFVACLAPFIMSSVGMEASWKPRATIEGFEAASKYFEGGYAAKIKSLFDDAAVFVKRVRSYRLQPSEGSLKGLASLVNDAAARLNIEAGEFMSHSPYLPLLEEDETREACADAAAVIYCVSHLASNLAAQSGEEAWGSKRIPLVKRSIRSMERFLSSTRETIETLLGLTVFNHDQSGPYMTVSMAIDLNRDRLPAEWPQVFSMAPSEVEERYFQPLKERFMGARERYLASKPPSLERQ